MKVSESTLSYLAEKSGIPIWVLGADGSLAYSSIAVEKLKDAEAAHELLGKFCGKKDTPQIQRLDESELFAAFRFADGAQQLTLIAGPAYETHPFTKSVKTAVSVNFLCKHDCVKPLLLTMPVVTTDEYCRYVAALADLMRGEHYDPDKLSDGIAERTLARLVNKQLVELLFDMREDERSTVYAPEEERKILAYVTDGDAESVRNFRMPVIKDPNTKGTRYQALFETVALVTLATRAAIAGGLDYVVAFSLSDLYFKRLSREVTEKEIAEINRQVLTHFAEKVRELGNKDEQAYSPYITRSVRYIRAHLHYHISLEEVAAELNINPKYLSRLFVSCRGEKFSSFVQRERVMEAKSLLENTDRSIIDVCNSLGFSSQSYFIKVFTRYVGMTPGQFLEYKRNGNTFA